MRSLLLTFVCLPLWGAAFGQGWDRMYQVSPMSSYTAVTQAPNGNWFFAGMYQQSTFPLSFSFPVILREVASNGQVLGEWTFAVPDNEATHIGDLMVLDDGSLILSGYMSYNCDLSPVVGYARCLLDGALLWDRSFAMGPLNDAAQNDSLLAFLSDGGVLFTDHSGDSLYTTTFHPIPFTRRIVATDQGFVVSGYHGAQSLFADGALSDSLVGVHVEDIIQMPAGTFLALTTDSVLELSANLERTGIGVQVNGYEPRGIAYEGGAVYVHTVDSLFSFTPGLVPLGHVAMDQPWEPTGLMNEIVGYWPRVVAFSDEEVMTAGSYACGVSGTASRSMLLNGTPSDLAMDVALTNLTVDSLIYSGSYGTAWTRAWLHNEGDAVLTSVTLNHVLPIVICGWNADSQAYDTLALAPGDSIKLAFGPFDLYEPFFQGDSLDICIWAARPNYRLDREPLDNEVCIGMAIDVTTGSYGPFGEGPHTLFPNPASGQVMLLPDVPQHGSFDLTFYDLQGRIILRRSMSFAGAPLAIDISGLNSGSFILEVVQADHRSQHRLVVE